MISREELLGVAHAFSEEERQVLDKIIELLPRIVLPEPLVETYNARINKPIAQLMDVYPALVTALAFLERYDFPTADVYLRAVYGKVY